MDEKAKLEKLGYDPEIAERIAVYRPDLSHLILSPEISVHPHEFTKAYPPSRPSSDQRRLEAGQVQDRKPITVYRGFTFSEGKVFDPTFFYLGDLPMGDSRIFTSDSLGTALSYANAPGKMGQLQRMQIPRFMLYEPSKPNGERDTSFAYGLVYYRDLVPNDLLFINGVASISYRPTEEQVEQVKTIVFESLKESDVHILHVPLSEEKRISSEGRFKPTAAWSDTICNISKHSKFELLLTKMNGKSESDQFISAFETLTGKNELHLEGLQREQAKVESAKQILSQLQAKSTSEEEGDEGEMFLSYVVESVHHCFNSRSMWLQSKLADIDK